MSMHDRSSKRQCDVLCSSWNVVHSTTKPMTASEHPPPEVSRPHCHEYPSRCNPPRSWGERWYKLLDRISKSLEVPNSFWFLFTKEIRGLQLGVMATLSTFTLVQLPIQVLAPM